MFLMHVSAAVLLASGCWLWLAGAGYSRAQTTLLAVMVLAEAGPLLAVATGQSLWLAVGVLSVTMSAEALTKRTDVRRIILFGGSLAAIQLLDPLGGVVAAGLLPAILALGRNRAGPDQIAGLYVVLMFMPVTVAALLLYFTRIQHLDPAGLFVGSTPHNASQDFAVHADLMWRLAPVAAFTLIVSPALLIPNRLYAESRGTILLVAFGVAVTGVIGAILGVARELVPLVAAAMPIVVAALVKQPESLQRNRDAFIVAMLCMALSWAVVFTLSPQVFAGG